MAKKTEKHETDGGTSTALAPVEQKAGPLAVLEQSKFQILRDPEIRQSLTENLAREAFTQSDLIRVPTPTGGATKWIFDDIDGPKQLEEITGLCVFYGLGGVLWPREGQAVQGTLPYLRTDDLLTAYRVGEDPGDLPVAEIERYRLPSGLYDWARLTDDPKRGGIFGWGTGQTGKGKRVKEYRTVCILRENDSFPLMFRAGPGSLKRVSPFFKRLTPYWRAIVEMKLEKKQGPVGPFSGVVPRFVEWISKEEGEAIRHMYVEPLKRMVNQLPLDPVHPADEE